MVEILAPRFFLIQTSYLSYLCAERQTRRLRHSPNIADPAYAPLLLAQVSGGGQTACIAPWAPDGGIRLLDDHPILEPFHPATAESNLADQDRTEFRAYPILVSRAASSGVVTVQDPFRGLFLAAAAAEGEASCGLVGFRKDLVGPAEHFRLHAFEGQVSAELCVMISQIGRLMAGAMTLRECAEVIAAAESALAQQTWLAICFRLFSFPQFVRLLELLREAAMVESSDNSLLLSWFHSAKRRWQRTAAKPRLRDGIAPFLTSCLNLQDLPRSIISASSVTSNKAAIDEHADIWITHALPKLIRWTADRRWSGSAANQLVVGPEFDFLQSWNREIPFVPHGWLANFIARYRTEPRKDICLVASARNEGPYLLEWIAHHRALGIQTFFIYSNDNDDGSEVLLRRLSEAGIIHYIENRVNPGTSPQYKAYKHALSVLPDVLDYRWTLILDLDEYLVLDPAKNRTIIDFLASFERENVDLICFNTVHFGSGGQARRGREFVRHRFDRRGQFHKSIKCVFRTNRFLTAHAHYPFSYRTLPLDVRHSSGAPHVNFFRSDRESAFFDPPLEGAAWVNHYHVKSAEEYLWTRMRGTGDWPFGTDIMSDNLLWGFLAQHHSPEVTIFDDRVVQCAPSFDDHYRELIEIPGVAEILETINENFQHRIAQLKEKFLDRIALGNSPEALAAFMAVLQEP